MIASLTRAATELVATAHSLFQRRLTHGSTGNISLRTPDGILITPTGVSLGSVSLDRLSLIDNDGRHISGPAPTKEAFLHAAVLRARPTANAVVHTHSTHSTAVSCIGGLDPENALPSLTAYYAMRVGKLRMLPFHAPGDASLEGLAEEAARDVHALLLSNHGPVVAGDSLPAAMDALEELEETAKLYLLLRNVPTRLLSTDESYQLATSARPRN